MSLKVLKQDEMKLHKFVTQGPREGASQCKFKLRDAKHERTTKIKATD